MTVSSFISRIHQSVGSTTWRPIVRGWAVLVLAMASLLAGPALAAVKTVNGISLEINMTQAQRGVSYSYQLSPSGQTSPYTFQILSGSLPAAFSMSSAGLVTGVNCVSSNGSYPFSLRVTAANGQFADFTSNQAVSMNMTAGPASGCALTGGAISSGGSTPQVGQYYSATISASGGSSPYTYTVATGSLPTGLSLSASGTLSGTPSAAGSFDFQIQSSDSAGNTGYTQYTLAVSAASSVVVSPSTLPTPVLGVAYSQTVTGSGGTSPYTFAVSSGSLPTGLSLNTSTGVISGTPTAAGAYSFTIRATDAGSQSNTRSYSGAIAAALAVTPTTLTTPVLNQAYSQTVASTGGTAPVTFAVSAGGLPAGLSLNASTGAITGTPSAAGAYSFTIQATDANSATATRAYSGTIAAALAITTASLPTPVLSQAYSQTVATSGGTAPVTFSVSTGSLPTGLSLNSSTGAITGAPTAAGAYSFTIQATDANSVAATQAYGDTIAAALTISTTSLPTPALSVAYSQTVATAGGTAPVTFAVSAGSLPTGLSLNTSTGAITGTPTAAGAYSFTIRATDSNSTTATKAYSGTIAGSLTITTGTVPTPVLNTAYSQTIATSGGTAAVTFAVSVGSLPAGLSLNASTGAITGTPTAAGAYSFTIEATDANSLTATQAYSGSISNGIVITTSTLPTPVLSTAYNQMIATSGGAAPVTFAVSAGSLPAGLSLNTSTGALSGTPAASGAYNFTIEATDNNSVTATQAYSGTISAALSITTATLPTPVLSTGYSQTIATSGGVAPVTFAVSAGSLPTGLSVNSSTGAITGTPTAAGAYSFTIRATDSNGVTATQAYSGAIAGNLAITTASLPTPVLNAAYSQTIATSGGTAPVTFAITIGSLPTGLSLNGSTGAITGTPSAAGAYSFTVQATDNNSVTATQAYSGAITSGLTITTATLPTPVLSTAYSQTVASTGGTAPVTFAISTGALPTGLSLNGSTGAITGTPSAAGAYSFTVQATDNNSVTATQAYSGAIASELAITTVTLPTPVLSTAYSQTVASTGGTAPVTFAVSAGSLPTGLSLNASTGAITGTATTAGAYSFTIRATDQNSVTTTRTYSGTIIEGLTAAAGLGPATTGQPYVGGVAAAGGQAPYSFSASGLPPGLGIDASGAITGTPSTAGSYSVTVVVKDANGSSATQIVTVVVAVAVTVSDQSVDVAYNSATTITLATLKAGDALELQSSPANGKLSQVGPIVEYTPNAGYIGADGFGFAIKGAWGQSRTASVTLKVLPPPPPTAEPPPTTTLDTTGPTGGTSSTGGSAGNGATGDAAVVVDKVNFNLASLVKGIVTDVQIATQPSHGKVELVRTATLIAARMTAERLCAAAAPAAPEITAVYTADKGYVGRDSFTFVAIGPGGVSAPATVNIQVIKSTPTAPVLKVKATGGRKVTVDLTAAATDGPFLAAALVASPAAAIGTARLIEGGSATAHTYALEFTSKGAFTGDITFTYTLTNSSGVSDPLTLILTIEARQDPTTDASVRAVNDAQTEAARRFAGAQMDNFGRRLESLHGGQTGDGFGLNLTSGVGQADACRMRAHTPEEERACREQAAKVDVKAGETPRQRPIGKVEVWTGGAITVGRRDADTRLAKLTVQTSGISGGADVRLSPAVTVGAGGGYASDVTKLSGGKGRVDADGWTAAAYASVHPTSGVFVDAVAGVGQLTFDTRRTTAASNELITGQRDATLRFGALTAGYDGAARHATWSLYLRAKALDAALDAYAERGSDAYALAYDKRQLNSLVGVIGGRVQFDREVGEVRITPRVRIEFSHEFASVDPQRIRYADWLDGASYQLVGDAWASDRVTLGVGSGFGFDNGWSLDLDLGAELAKHQSSAMARVGAAKRF